MSKCCPSGMCSFLVTCLHIIYTTPSHHLYPLYHPHLRTTFTHCPTPSIISTHCTIPTYHLYPLSHSQPSSLLYCPIFTHCSTPSHHLYPVYHPHLSSLPTVPLPAIISTHAIHNHQFNVLSFQGLLFQLLGNSTMNACTFVAHHLATTVLDQTLEVEGMVG